MLQRIIFLFLLLLCFFEPLAQNNNPNYVKKLVHQKPGHFYTNYIYKNGKVKTTDIDMTEMINLIVEFKKEPFFIRASQKKQLLDKSSYLNTFSRFAKDLNTMNQNSSLLLKTSLNPPEIKKQYYKIFFGESIKVSRALRDAIASLNYVKKIFKDSEVRAVEEKINEREITKKVKTDTLTGKGIVIGILDTGIDYKHPALGGGIGPGFKIIGGYDFVNDDDDPMDDNGHGTHVAGIIAAKGDSITGVAPDVSLLAFKVLDKYGSGTMSTVLEGIERTVDPNNDGNINDKVDIVNMSLGGSGNSADPLSVAVDNASKLGVTFCIAAGNGGDYNQIGSPGTAKSAITVGAVDNQNNLAYFSSRGPNKGNYFIKPEVVAPGVDIKSTYLNNTYAVFSGTSMATPFVAGVCGLIKELHPDWRPEMIKSSIVNTADHIVADIMSQGGGEINLVKAEATTSLVVPSTLSFGLDDSQQSIWMIEDTIDIINKNTIPQNYSLSITGLREGISISANPSGFSLAPGNDQKVIFTLDVNNSQIDYIDIGPRSYMGDIQISSTYESLHLPWAFVKTPIVVLNFAKPVLDFTIANNTQYYFSSDANWLNDFYRAELMVSRGEFTAVVEFGNADSIMQRKSNVDIDVKEKIKLEGYNELYFSPDEATNKIEIKGVDENGRQLSSLNNSEKDYIIVFPDSLAVKLVFFVLESDYSCRISNLSGEYKIICGEFQQDIFNEKKVRVIQFKKITGINNNLTLTNNPADFKKVNINATLSPFADSSHLYFNNELWFHFNLSGLILGYYRNNIGLDTNVWNGSLYLSLAKDSSVGNTTSIMTNIRIIGPNLKLGYETPMFNTSNDSIGLYGLIRTPDILFYPNNGEMIIGKGAVFPTISFDYSYINNNTVNLNYIFPAFMGQLKEFKEDDSYLSKYTIYDNQDNIIKSDSVKNFVPFTINLGVYKVEIINKNFLIGNNTIGTAIYRSIFDLTKHGSASPVFRSLQIRDSRNYVANKLQKDEAGKLFFSVKDIGEAGLKSVEVYVKNYSNTQWQNASLQKIGSDINVGNMYVVDLSPFTTQNNSAMDLKIIATNNSNNSTEYILEPAYTVGKFTGNFIGPYKTKEELSSYKIFNNYPNPFNNITVFQYSLPEDSHIQIDIYNILGQHVEELFKGDQKKGLYKLPWNAYKFASGVYIYRFTADGTMHFQKTGKMLLLK